MFNVMILFLWGQVWSVCVVCSIKFESYTFHIVVKFCIRRHLQWQLNGISDFCILIRELWLGFLFWPQQNFNGFSIIKDKHSWYAYINIFPSTDTETETMRAEVLFSSCSTQTCCLNWLNRQGSSLELKSSILCLGTFWTGVCLCRRSGAKRLPVRVDALHKHSNPRVGPSKPFIIISCHISSEFSCV